MATSTSKDGNYQSSLNADLLLHPELLSQEFMKMLLHEKKISTADDDSHDRLTELYLRHVMPLPQRTLPNNRWGKRMERHRGRPTLAGHGSNSSLNDHNRKRPQIVFDGSSSHPAPLKVKKLEGSTMPKGITDRLKPPPTASLSNPILKLGSAAPPSTASSSAPVDGTHAPNLKREADASGALQSPKRKIHHVTWP